MGKLKIGFYALTSCYGCQLQLAMMDEILTLMDKVDLVCWFMLERSSKENEEVDVAFVEGSVSTEDDLRLLKKIRENSKILVAVGSCAVLGGVQSWEIGDKKYEELWRAVYGREKIEMPSKKSKPIEEFVKVDYRLYGCPPEKKDFLYALGAFLIGSYPEDIDYPVCAECRMNGFPCVLIEKGEPCLGPVTRAGCNARCPGFGVACIGCRGAIGYDVAWFDSLARIFKNKGYSREYIIQRMKMFNEHNKDLESLINKVFEEEDKDGK